MAIDLRAVLVRHEVAIGHHLQPQVHQLAPVRDVMEDVRDMHMPLVVEVRQLARQEEADHLVELALDADRSTASACRSS